MFCSKCGIKIYQEKSFCPQCGYKIDINAAKFKTPVVKPEAFPVIKPMAKPPKEKRAKNILLAIIPIFLVITIAVGVTAWYFESEKTKYEMYLDYAQADYEKNNFEECINNLEKIHSNYYYKKFYDALSIESKSYMELENYNAAIDTYNKLLEIKKEPDSYINLAVCYAKNGDSEKAMSTLENIDKRNDVRLYVEGEIHFKEENLTAAESKFKNVISITKDESLKRNAYVEAAQIYKHRRHQDTTNYYYLNSQIEIMEEAVRELKSEDDLELTEMMAEAYFTAKKYDLSVQKFNRLLELGYSRPYIYRNIAIIHQQTGKLESAATVLLQMKEKYPDDYSCYMQLSFVYIEMENKKAESLRDYTKAYNNYKLAKEYADSKNENELIQLEKTIEELKNKGWL